MKNWLRKQFRKKTRVYIFPTQMGGYLIGLIFLMFLMAIGYDNNLLLIFTLFLFSFNLLWLVQSHFHLHGLKLKNITISDGHADEEAPIQLFWEGSPKEAVSWKVSLETKKQKILSDVFEQDGLHLSGGVKLPSRGLLEWRYARVSSVNPYGLYRVWCYYPLKIRTYSYPSIIKNMPFFETQDLHQGENVARMRRGHEDIWTLSPYQGEESSKISWKHYAKAGELLVKEGEEYSDTVFHIKLKIPEEDKEGYLSEVATQMVWCHRRGASFVLDTPTVKLGPANTSEYLHECLKVLALC